MIEENISNFQWLAYHDAVAVTPFEVKIVPLNKSWFLLFALFYLLAFFIPITEVTLFTFKERMPTATFSQNKNQTAFSTSI